MMKCGLFLRAHLIYARRIDLIGIVRGRVGGLGRAL